jgi:hypothetical protein
MKPLKPFGHEPADMLPIGFALFALVPLAMVGAAYAVMAAVALVLMPLIWLFPALGPVFLK